MFTGRKQLDVIRWLDLREERKLLAFTRRKFFSSLIMTRTPRPHAKKESSLLLAVKHYPRSREDKNYFRVYKEKIISYKKPRFYGKKKTPRIYKKKKLLGFTKRNKLLDFTRIKKILEITRQKILLQFTRGKKLLDFTGRKKLLEFVRGKKPLDITRRKKLLDFKRRKKPPRVFLTWRVSNIKGILL